MVETYALLNKTESDLIRNIVSSYTFLDYGIVSRVNSGSVDVKLITKKMGQELELKDVELLGLGSGALSVRVEAVEGDLVLLLGLRTYIDKLSSVESPLDKVSRLYYDLANVKAVQIAPPKESKVTLTVSGDGKVTLQASGNISISTDGRVDIAAMTGLGLGAGTGLASLGNDVKSLATWLNGFITDLTGLITVGSAVTQTISPTTIAALQLRAAELSTFLE